MMVEMASQAKEKTEADVSMDPADANEDYASGARLSALIASLMFGMFLVALDNVSSLIAAVSTCSGADHNHCQTILSTAIPKITDQFRDLSKVSWYGAAYFMTFGGSEQSEYAHSLLDRLLTSGL